MTKAKVRSQGKANSKQVSEERARRRIQRQGQTTEVVKRGSSFVWFGVGTHEVVT